MTDEKNTNEITYEDGWQDASYPEYSTPASNSESDEILEKEAEKKPEKAEKHRNAQVLVTAQLIICILLALAALIIKTIGGDFYSDARQWYYGELNKYIIAESSGEDYSLSRLFGTSTDDEI